MTTEIIVAIIGAIAVITAAIITKKTMPKIEKRRRSVDFEFHQQNADIHGNKNDVEQTMNNRGCSQSATIKGDGNKINQKIK